MFRATRDGDSSKKFHQCCDNKLGGVLCIYIIMFKIILDRNRVINYFITLLIIIKPINTDNSHNIWSFLPNENPVSYLGYPNYQYNNYNIGILLLRISGSQKIYYLDKMINSFKADSKGSLLISANLDPNDYLLYEPKGVLSITINGGIHYDENELYSPYDINSIMSN